MSSAFAIAAVGRFWSWRPGSGDWRIAWVNMGGSLFFGLSAVAGYVLPDGVDLNVRVSVAGTFIGAICFLIGPLATIPAELTPRRWRRPPQAG